jgi:transglutaminase-like putative cysteine protease
MPRLTIPILKSLSLGAPPSRVTRPPLLQGPPAGMGYASFAQLTAPRPSLGKTIDWIKRFAYQGQGDQVVRRQVEQICAGLTPGDYAGEALACYYWVCKNIRYIRDPLDVEYVKQPSVTLSTRTGDCDDQAALLAAMFMTCGNRAALCVAAFGQPAVPSHVFPMVMSPGGWVALDPVANRVSAQMQRAMSASQIYPL